ncbi:MAG: Hpt domain-containing protein [Calditrichaeota bacterium]|nr:MAG: Hpt domain-containing protein [Calditrichota bacterium]
MENVVYVDADLEDLIPEFLENRHADVVMISELLTCGNLGEIQRLGHSMKGSGGGYGFDEITRIGAAIEEAAKATDLEAVRRLNHELSRYLSNVKVVFQEES